MPNEQPIDYYEILQISPSAEPETVHRVYRLLAQRFHPDNRDTGDGAVFRTLSEAYQVLSDPERRAQYDAVHTQQQQARWRLVTDGAKAENDFDAERHVRLTVLEVLYTRRRMEPDSPGLSPRELEGLIGTAREHLEFTFWYLGQKRLIARDDQSIWVITAEGVDHLENNYSENLRRRRLTAGEPDRAGAAREH